MQGVRAKACFLALASMFACVARWCMWPCTMRFQPASPQSAAYTSLKPKACHAIF